MDILQHSIGNPGLFHTEYYFLIILAFLKNYGNFYERNYMFSKEIKI